MGNIKKIRNGAQIFLIHSQNVQIKAAQHLKSVLC